MDGVTVLEHSIDRSSSYWIYTIRVERQADFMKMMAGKGIMVSRVHERNDQHTCVLEYRRNLPTLDRVVKEMICIPAQPNDWLFGFVQLTTNTVRRTVIN